MSYSGVNLKPLKVGDVVRYLWWTRKEQVKDLVLKGYEDKWSDSLHRVKRITHNKKGMAIFRLSQKLGPISKDDKPFPNHTYFRWELQHVNMTTLDITPPHKDWTSQKGKIHFEKMDLKDKDAQPPSVESDPNATV